MPPSFCSLSFWKSSQQSFALQTQPQLSGERQSALKGANPGARSHSQKHPPKITKQTANVCLARKVNKNQLLLPTRQEEGRGNPVTEPRSGWNGVQGLSCWQELPVITRWNSPALPWTFRYLSTDSPLLVRNIRQDRDCSGTNPSSQISSFWGCLTPAEPGWALQWGCHSSHLQENTPPHTRQHNSHVRCPGWNKSSERA